ncbi:hypothetical protein SXM_3768 [Shewanella xiamenensis]|nr:hypothetical protein SXM_3768 [Shewanella xiamenensis]
MSAALCNGEIPCCEIDGDEANALDSDIVD